MTRAALLAARPKSTPAYVGPGDIVPGATAWYGLRAYNAAYATGSNKAINIRRASDNATMDILILNTGDLDVATAATFLASTTGFVATWYDQSGNGADASNPTAANQPQLVFNAIGVLPGTFFVKASSQQLVSSAVLPALTAPFSGSVVANATTTAGYEGIFFTTGTAAGLYSGAGGSSGKWEWFAGSEVPATASNNAFHAFQGVSGASGVNNVDGTETTGNVGSNSTGTRAYIGSDGGGSYLDGYVCEAGLWPGGFSSGHRTSLYQNQHTYWGTA